MSVTIADKLIEAAQNEQRIYKKGYDLGYEEGYRECECPKAVERSFIARENGNYKFTPADGEVFSLVKLTIAVPSDSKEEEEGVFEVLENGEYDFLPSADKVFSKVKVTVDVPSGEIEGKINVTDEFSISVYPGDASMGTLSYSYCPPTSEGGTTFTMMEINSFGFVAASKYDGLVPGDVYDVYCVPFGELWETVVFANRDYQTLAIPSSNANIRQYARYYEDEGRLRITIPPDFSGQLFINVKWLDGGCAIYKVEESEGGGTDDGSYDEGYADGRQAEYDAFWDGYQDYGNRIDCDAMFANQGWNDTTFKPKYDIRPRSASKLFSYAKITDLKGILESQGVVLDMSNVEYMNYIIESNACTITRLPELKMTRINNLSYFISNAEKLISVDKVILKNDGSQTLGSNTFRNLKALEEIRFEGVIGKAGIDLQHSTKLSHDSIVSIVNALSTTTSGLSITLSKTAVNTAFATTTGGTDGSTSAEWTALVATRANWTISLV